jgi:hypothetical protein
VASPYPRALVEGVGQLSEGDISKPVSRRAVLGLAVGFLLGGTLASHARRRRGGWHSGAGWYPRTVRSGRQGWGIPALLAVIGSAGIVIAGYLLLERILSRRRGSYSTKLKSRRIRR